ncbi:MAG TPA: DNA polymerase IV, partial [Thermoanaerobaculia bacterium]
YGDFTTITRSRTLDLPTCDERAIAACAQDLLTRTAAATRPVRLLGVGASNLVRGEVWQLPLFGG